MTLPTIDAAELARVRANLPPFIPPRVQQDWPKLDFSRNTGQGVVIDALGMQLSSVFQPILTAQGEILGEEAFLRARSHGLQIPPASVFRIAAAQDQLVAFDRLCRTLHLLNYLTSSHEQKRLFLNVHPRLLTEVSVHGVVFDEILQSVHWSASHVTLEFPESELFLSDPSRSKHAIDNYRRRGFGIAIDHFGLHATELDALLALAPDMVKFDRQLRCEDSTRQRQSLAHLVTLLHEAGVQVVMQGIETPVQYQLAVDAGVDLFQGFYLSSPRVLPSDL